MKKLTLLLILITNLYSINLTHAKDLSKRQIQAKLNIVNGYASECVMNHFYTSTGWIRIEGEVGRNGIDGLYYKLNHGNIKEILVAESKWNKSRLGRSGKDKLLKQMSKRWVLKTLDRLIKYKLLPKYKTLKRLIENNQYRARLFQFAPRSKDKVFITIYRLKNKGDNDFSKIIESNLKPIKMGNPRNNFGGEILKRYDSCRKSGLNKYLPSITDEQVNYLLLDNYIKADDVMKLYL